MAGKGLFITLGDEDSLRLYLRHGVYSQRMPDYRQLEAKEKSLSAHYGTLADYATARSGDHVFFFGERTIYYGGQIQGPEDGPAFGFNGPFSALIDDTPVVWDESVRDQYDVGTEPGAFTYEGRTYSDGELIRYCHPYLIEFETDDRTGAYVSSDDLYWELGDYRYPLMSNSISNRGFTELTPGETEVLLEVMEDPDGTLDTSDAPDVKQDSEPRWFSRKHGWSDLSEVDSERELEAAVIAEPDLLPAPLRPGEETVVLRQVPMTPYKPYGDQADRADVCYYDMQQPLEDGTLPNTLIELKMGKAGGPPARQAARYRRWLSSLLDASELSEVEVVVFAPEFYLKNFTSPKYAGDQTGQITAWEFGASEPLVGPDEPRG